MADGPPVIPITVSRSSSYREIYANAINTRMNLYDLGITFGYVTNSGPGVGALNLLIEEALVTMSYGEAKFLAQVLSRHIEAYEKAFGPVATQDLPQATVDGLEQTVASLRANNLRPG